jgi:hypothetical protein
LRDYALSLLAFAECRATHAALAVTPPPILIYAIFRHFHAMPLDELSPAFSYAIFLSTLSRAFALADEFSRR